MFLRPRITRIPTTTATISKQRSHTEDHREDREVALRLRRVGQLLGQVEVLGRELVRRLLVHHLLQVLDGGCLVTGEVRGQTRTVGLGAAVQRVLRTRDGELLDHRDRPHEVERLGLLRILEVDEAEHLTLGVDDRTTAHASRRGRGDLVDAGQSLVLTGLGADRAFLVRRLEVRVGHLVDAAREPDGHDARADVGGPADHRKRRKVGLVHLQQRSVTVRERLELDDAGREGLADVHATGAHGPRRLHLVARRAVADAVTLLVVVLERPLRGEAPDRVRSERGVAGSSRRTAPPRRPPGRTSPRGSRWGSRSVRRWRCTPRGSRT